MNLIQVRHVATNITTKSDYYKTTIGKQFYQIIWNSLFAKHFLKEEESKMTRTSWF